MNKHLLRYFSILITALFFSTSYQPLLAQQKSLPPIIYWAWESPQDLSLIDPKTSGVAVLAASIYIKSDKPIYYLRQQPFRCPADAYRIAVIHIEARPRWNPQLDQQLAEAMALQIKKIYQRKFYDGLQIDFEVSVNQRPFYQQLLLAIRKQMGKELFISVTSLASWCTGEGWMGKSNLPVDLVVPMYFSLSNDPAQRQAFINQFPKTIGRLAPECKAAIGLATFEQWQLPLRAQVPVFVFTKGRWNSQTLLQANQLAIAIQH